MSGKKQYSFTHIDQPQLLSDQDLAGGLRKNLDSLETIFLSAQNEARSISNRVVHFYSAGLQQLAQWINTRFSTFQFNNVTLVHGGVSCWLFDCVVTSNQPDTPPFFNRLNTRFDNNSSGVPRTQKYSAHSPVH